MTSSGDELGDPLIDPLTTPVLPSLDSTTVGGPDQLDVLEAALAEGAASDAQAAPVQRGAFTIAGDEISWRCRFCEAENELAAVICTLCGAQFARAIKPTETTGPVRDPNTVALYSVIFPGAGHAYMGNWPQAIARGVLYTWVFLITVLAIVAGGARGLPIALIFGPAAFGLWVVTAHDAYREAAGQGSLVILRGRRFLWLTIALLGLLFVMLTVGFVSAQGG